MLAEAIGVFKTSSLVICDDFFEDDSGVRREVLLNRTIDGSVDESEEDIKIV